MLGVLEFRQFLRKMFMFWEISRNCLGVGCCPPGNACSRTQFLGFLYKLSNDYVLSARRRKLACLIALFSRIM